MTSAGKKRFLLMLVGVIAWLTSCSLLPETEMLRLFALPTLSNPSPGQGEVLPVQLRIRSFQSNRMLASSRIVVVPQENELTVYRGARWSDPAPVLLRNRLLEAFKSNGRVQAVYSEENRLQADMELSGVLTAFQSEYSDGEVQVRIQVDLHLTDAGGRRLIAHRRFDVREPSRNQDMEEVVVSFGRAGDVLSQQVLDWALVEIAESVDR